MITSHIMASDRNGTLYIGVTGIIREKQLKTWKRSWKINLIEQSNPYWQDLPIA
jgi:predicted GIY-YIG superfamily endonuclease